jgi:phosphoribosylformylglycinamidine synthase
MHINQLMEQPAATREFQILCVPGGFSYGDDIGAGRILASKFSSRLRDCVEEFRHGGKLVLGICNGFQVLIKTGFLVPPDADGLPVTLTWNHHGRYDCRWVTLRPADSKCVFLQDTDLLYLPIAHAEGRFVVRDTATLSSLKQRRQLALKYVQPDGSNHDVPWPWNPNGSDDHIAGICDETGHVFGLMPHPERYVDHTQHPRWTRLPADLPPDGLKIFQNAVRHFS